MLEFFHRYDMESAYTTPRGTSEPLKSYKRRLYTLRAAAGRPELRIEKLRPSRLGSDVEELEQRTNSGNHEKCMVSSHRWNNSYEWASSPYQNGTKGYLPTICSEGYTRAPSTGLWWRKNGMGILKTPNSKDVKDDSEPDTRRLDKTPSIPHMASQETSSNTMDTKLN